MGLVILAMWLVWGGFADVAVYRSSTSARLETDPPPSRVATTLAGRIDTVELNTGKHVDERDTLLQLDTTQVKIAVDRARGRVAALAPQIDSLAREVRLQVDEEQQRLTAEQGAEGEALARLRGAQADLSAAEHELVLETDAVKAGVSPVVVRDRAETTAQQKRAAVEAIQHESQALVATHRGAGDSRRGLKEQLDRQYAELSNELAAAKSQLAQSEVDLDHLTIRAPVSGVLGEVMQLRPGAVLHEGDVIATIVPDHRKLHVIAAYGADALGLLKPGQHAFVRLDGFPWTHYGTVDATVTSVGSELRDNVIRVELDLGAANDRITTANGMTGNVDVETSRASPFGLFLRMIGQGSR
ncbi:MAG: HlyD family efflux transporter periplasmic adaptor subunit [Kofleriaceae bacterium]